MEPATAPTSFTSNTWTAEHVRSLDIAARSIMDSERASASWASMLADRTLDHFWGGIFQHMALRVGAEQATKLLLQLECETEQQACTQPPSSSACEVERRVALYQHVRRLLNGAPIAFTGQQVSLWHPEHAGQRRKLSAVRHALATQYRQLELEIIELRFARGLSAAEVSAVLEVALEEVSEVAGAALACAQRLLSGRPASHDHKLACALLEAFALDSRRVATPRRRHRPPVLALNTVIAERYEIEALLGAGAFADVYRARDREVRDHVVALKILRMPADEPNAVRNALRELQLTASVFHPSVVQLKDHGWHAGHLWFVMPLYRGETLAARLSRGPLSRREAREIFEPLAEGLATMHRAGVLHQDIKPDNVLLASLDSDTDTDVSRATRRILPVLLDLGVAAKDAELVLAGTPAFFAPEVAARFAGAPDPALVGPKADVFALALTLRYALDPQSIEDVAGGSVDAFVAFRALHAPPAPTRDDLRDLRPWFGRWLNFRPDARPSAQDFSQELAQLTRPEERRARRGALLRMLVPSAIALLTLFGAVVYALSREAASQRTQAQTAQQRADQAGKRAERVSANLSVQQARRLELEADVAHLRNEYQSSRMTRAQLAARLAQTESQLALWSERQSALSQQLRQQSLELRKQHDLSDQLATELAGVSTRRDELQLRLEHASAALDAERARHAELEVQLQATREQLEHATSAAQHADARAEQIKARWAILRLLNPYIASDRAGPSPSPASARDPSTELGDMETKLPR